MEGTDNSGPKDELAQDSKRHNVLDVLEEMVLINVKTFVIFISI